MLEKGWWATWWGNVWGWQETVFFFFCMALASIKSSSSFRKACMAVNGNTNSTSVSVLKYSWQLFDSQCLEYMELPVLCCSHSSVARSSRHFAHFSLDSQLFFFPSFSLCAGALDTWSLAWLARASSATLGPVGTWMGKRQVLTAWFTRGQGCKTVVPESD